MYIFNLSAVTINMVNRKKERKKKSIILILNKFRSTRDQIIF